MCIGLALSPRLPARADKVKNAVCQFTMCFTSYFMFLFVAVISLMQLYYYYCIAAAVVVAVSALK